MLWMKKRKKKPGNPHFAVLTRTGTQDSGKSSLRVPADGLKPHWPVAAVIFGLALLLPVDLSGKEKKVIRTVTGAVLDEADNGIVGATVTLTDLQAGKKNATYSQEEGRYQFTDLDPNHDYEVQATHKGVSSDVRRASSVDTRARIVLNLRIPPSKE